MTATARAIATTPDDKPRSLRELATSHCGTVMCMAGWECVRIDADPFAALRNPGDAAMDSLGLTLGQRSNLFTPDHMAVDYAKITPAIAADVLVAFANSPNGQVRWPESVMKA